MDAMLCAMRVRRTQACVKIRNHNNACRNISAIKLRKISLVKSCVEKNTTVSDQCCPFSWHYRCGHISNCKFNHNPYDYACRCVAKATDCTGFCNSIFMWPFPHIIASVYSSTVTYVIANSAPAAVFQVDWDYRLRSIDTRLYLIITSFS